MNYGEKAERKNINKINIIDYRLKSPLEIIKTASTYNK
jgi:hypothetical protein